MFHAGAFLNESRKQGSVGCPMAPKPKWDDIILMNRKHLSILLVTALLTWLNAGCRTMEGAGKDIEKAGEEIQDSAK